MTHSLHQDSHLIRERTHFAICRRMVTERKKLKKISSLNSYLLSEFLANVYIRGLQYLKLNGNQKENDRYW
jgi:hypothetical protein